MSDTGQSAFLMILFKGVLCALLLFPQWGVASSAPLEIASGEKAYSVLPKAIVSKMLEIADTDSVTGPLCGRGFYNVLKELDLEEGLSGADGHDWEENLWAAGWRPIRCSSPYNAPFGSALVYDSDLRLLGFNKRKTPGGKSGHIEGVGWCVETGKRKFFSSYTSYEPGGTVEDNFMGRAWVPPSFVALFRKVRGYPLPDSGFRPDLDRLGGYLEEQVKRGEISPQDKSAQLLAWERVFSREKAQERALPSNPSAPTRDSLVLFSGGVPLPGGLESVEGFLQEEETPDAILLSGSSDFEGSSSNVGRQSLPLRESPQLVRERMGVLIGFRLRDAKLQLSERARLRVTGYLD